MEKVIEVKGLVKRYGNLTAVNSISFDVRKGEIFGLLGENGAGKTTALEIIEGIRKPSEGEVTVLGHNVLHESKAMKQRIGVQLQSSSYYQYLTLEEILRLFGSFYGLTIDTAALLEMVDLQHKARSYVSTLSGGQRQRFSIVASLVNNPDIVFLDEPTTGLDPVARRNLWQIIAKIRARKPLLRRRKCAPTPRFAAAPLLTGHSRRAVRISQICCNALTRSATFARRMRCSCMKSRRQCETANAARKRRGSYEDICKRTGCDRRSVIVSSICSGG